MAEAKETEPNKESTQSRDSEATSGNSMSDRKGGGSPDETTSKSHRMAGVSCARHKLHHSRGARSSAESNLAGDEAQVMSL
jgi:hypothetical protein